MADDMCETSEIVEHEQSLAAADPSGFASDPASIQSVSEYLSKISLVSPVTENQSLVTENYSPGTENEPGNVFTCFPRLPKELQDQIWLAAIPDPRVIYVNIDRYTSATCQLGFVHTVPLTCRTAVEDPAMLRVCQDSRAAALKVYECWFDVGIGFRAPIYLDRSRDTIFVHDTRQLTSFHWFYPFRCKLKEKGLRWFSFPKMMGVVEPSVRFMYPRDRTKKALWLVRAASVIFGHFLKMRWVTPDDKIIKELGCRRVIDDVFKGRDALREKLSKQMTLAAVSLRLDLETEHPQRRRHRPRSDSVQ